jgi:prevent-host-death family protein
MSHTSHVWQVQEAKSRFSEVLDKAVSEGPQIITRHGKPVAKVIAASAETLTAEADDGFLEFLLSMPKSGLKEGLPRMPRRNRRKPLFGDE